MSPLRNLAMSETSVSSAIAIPTSPLVAPNVVPPKPTAGVSLVWLVSTITLT